MRDLRGQHSGGVEPLLVSNAMEKLQMTVLGRCRHVVTEYKRFDRQAIAAERGANANVRHRVQRLSVIQRDARHVHAVLRQEFIVTLQV